MALKMSRGVTIKQKQVNTKRVCAWHGQNVAYGLQLERERVIESYWPWDAQSGESSQLLIYVFIFGHLHIG